MARFLRVLAATGPMGEEMWVSVRNGWGGRIGRVEEADGCEDAGVMAITDVGTARGAVTGGKLMEVRAGPDKLEDELEGINGIVGVAEAV